MRKPSTTALRQRGKLQGEQLTIGLDLGDRSSVYCVLNGAGEVVLEAKVSTNPEAMRKAFEKMPSSRIALETGTHSPWVSRLLTEFGHEAIVAHSRNVRLIGESRRKDDRLDAQALARLARIDPQLLSPIQHRSAQAQAKGAVAGTRHFVWCVQVCSELCRCEPSPCPHAINDGVRGRLQKAAPTVTRTPICTERISRSPRVRMEG
jgi:transposase